jgi:ABC-2 type transport system ATP-binding protein
LSTHILSEVETVCERVIIINGGRLGLDSRLADMETDPVIVMEVRGPAEQVASVLRTTDGVTQVRAQPAGDGVVGLEIRTTRAQDLREVVSQRVAKNGWIIRRLDLRRRKLEDRFLEVLREEDPILRHPPLAPSEPVSEMASS